MKMLNFISGEYEEVPGFVPGWPSEYWVEGWECYMYFGLARNPYDEGTYEAVEWEDGYTTALLDY